MKKINNDIFLIIFLVIVISVISLNYKDNSNSGIVKDDVLLYEEAKFYGINLKNINIDFDNKKNNFRNNIYIEEARFWGIQQKF